jgi:hypothetical protein
MEAYEEGPVEEPQADIKMRSLLLFHGECQLLSWLIFS